MEQAAQIFTDYYEGEVNVKPSDIRYRNIPDNNDDPNYLVGALIPQQFEQQPLPVVLIKNDNNIVNGFLYEDTRPYLTTDVEPIIYESKPLSVSKFMEMEQLANEGFLLIGWTGTDSSLIGLQIHQSNG